MAESSLPQWIPPIEIAGRHVVVVGAGFGGLTCVRAFNRKGVMVTIIDQTNHHTFQPLLYQVATAGLSVPEISSPVRTVFSNRKDVTCLLGEVTGVDCARRRLTVDATFEVPYDYLVLAAGAQTSYFGHAEWARYAPGLKTLMDARKIRDKLLMAFELAEKTLDAEVRNRLMTVVIVGAGPTGVEMAGAVAELARHVLRRDFRHIKPEQAHVILVQHGPRVLEAFSEKLSEFALEQLQRMGVDVRLQTRVLDVSADHVSTDKGDIPTANIVWTAGVTAAPLTALLGLPLDHGGRVAVEADLRLPGHDREYAIGDMAAYQHPHTYGGKMLPGLSPPAMQEAKWAAANILRQIRGDKTAPFHYKDPGTMATIGRSSAVAAVKGLELRGLLAWLAWLFVHLINLVDFENRVLVVTRWIWAYVSWRRGARVIVGNEKEELALARNMTTSTPMAASEINAPG